MSFAIENYFVFDMSIPDSIEYLNHGINFFSRQSEHEKKPVLYENCKGIWLDSFMSIWYSSKLIIDHLNHKKQVAIVSPELHNRGHIPLWNMLRTKKILESDNVILCTDFLVEAKKFFDMI